MPPVLSKIKNKKIHGQTREVVFNVLEFFEEEARTWGGENFIVPVQNCQLRCSRATGISLRTITRIKKEGKTLDDTTTFVTPDKTRERKKTVTELDEFEKSVIRRTVHSFYVDEKCVPTIHKLRLKLIELIDFKGGNTSLRKILKDLGFKWRKTRNNRQILIEREDVRNRRIDFIRQVRQYRREGRPIVYTDETYVVTNHSAPSSWQDDTTGGLHTPVGNGDRLIIVHAGGEDGFVPNAFIQWKASQQTGDYHCNMNQRNYEKWINDKLLPNLKPKSVLIIDNASYHNVQKEKVPTKRSLKSEMQEWLKIKNVAFTPEMVKAELFELISINKPATRYNLDDIIEKKGHTVLRLPPYHPDLNAIELIWSQMKGYVASNNTQFTMSSVIDLVTTKISEIGADEWKECCKHVKAIEDQYIEREGIIDEFVDRLVINIGEGDSDSQYSEIEDSSDNEDMELSGIEEL